MKLSRLVELANIKEAKFGAPKAIRDSLHPGDLVEIADAAAKAAMQILKTQGVLSDEDAMDRVLYNIAFNQLKDNILTILRDFP